MIGEVKILDIQWQGPGEQVMEVTVGNTRYITTYPGGIYETEIGEWLAVGNTIREWQSLDELKVGKYLDISNYVDGLIKVEEITFFRKGVYSSRNKDRLIRGQNKRNDKKLKGDKLSPKEKKEDDKYDSFMDWVDTIYDEADLAEDTVEIFTTHEEVENYDVSTDPNWSAWNE